MYKRIQGEERKKEEERREEATEGVGVRRETQRRDGLIKHAGAYPIRYTHIPAGDGKERDGTEAPERRSASTVSSNTKFQ